MSEALSGAEFKKQLREGQPKLGLFLNSHSPTVAEQLAHSGYDWLLVDTQHGPMGFRELSAMLAGISSGGAKSLVRVAGYHDRPGIQQSLDLGADGVLVPYINTAEEARQAVSCRAIPTPGTRSVYFPQRSMNKAGLLGYAGARKQEHHRRAAGGDRGLHQEYRRDRGRPRRGYAVSRPERSVHVHGLVSKSTSSRTCTLRRNCRRPPKNCAPRRQKEQCDSGPVPVRHFARVANSSKRASRSSDLGNDLHHILTQAGAYVKDVEANLQREGQGLDAPPDRVALIVPLTRLALNDISIVSNTYS